MGRMRREKEREDPKRGNNQTDGAPTQPESIAMIPVLDRTAGKTRFPGMSMTAGWKKGAEFFLTKQTPATAIREGGKVGKWEGA